MKCQRIAWISPVKSVQCGTRTHGGKVAHLCDECTREAERLNAEIRAEVVVSNLQKYSDFAPTGFDRPGAFCDDRQDWLIAPVSITRDSESLAVSNWITVISDLTGQDRPDDTNALDDSDDVEVHRFGHWGPGWYEIALIRPGSKAADKAEEWHDALADYPVADEMHWSELEYNEAAKAWEYLSIPERFEVVQRFGGPDGVSIFAIRRDELVPTVTGELVSYLGSGC